MKATQERVEFRAAPMLRRTYLSARIPRDDRSVIEIDEPISRHWLALTVPEARALRDWLDKVLP